MADDSTPRQRDVSKRTLRVLLLASLLGILGIAFVYQWVADPSGDGRDPASVALVVMVTAIIFAAERNLRRREREDADRASWNRLRRAEQQLEKSLRGSGTVYTDQGEAFDFVRGSVEQPVPHGVDEGPEDYDLLLSADELTASRDLTLSHLWAVTNARLDLYHDIATRQARQAFRNAQAAMVTGFLLLAAFVTVALKASTTTGAVVAGGLGAVSAALSGYVSRTFVKSQETAAGHLKAYFDQPLEFARYLTAERLITESGLTEAQRQEAVMALVKGLATPPGGGALPREASEQQQA
ncbi:hypothetical protein ACIRH0_03925 [Streptomyces sp. NPDC093675]|uniref:hypothetical protein n=1 Tax=Streptomyces sp. NPDC093675 TaxID=3366049 RepID=UPI003801FD89